jgi:hypothetical protein
MARTGRRIVNLVRGFICTATYLRLPVGQALGPRQRRALPHIALEYVAVFLKPRT